MSLVLGGGYNKAVRKIKKAAPLINVFECGAAKDIKKKCGQVGGKSTCVVS